MNFEKSWAITRKHLEKARSFLPTYPIQTDITESIEAYQDFIDHNEFELAMGQLEGLGEVHPCPKAFWKELKLAAQNMGLAKSVAYYDAKLFL